MIYLYIMKSKVIRNILIIFQINLHLESLFKKLREQSIIKSNSVFEKINAQAIYQKKYFIKEGNLFNKINF